MDINKRHFSLSFIPNSACNEHSFSIFWCFHILKSCCFSFSVLSLFSTFLWDVHINFVTLVSIEYACRHISLYVLFVYNIKCASFEPIYLNNEKLATLKTINKKYKEKWENKKLKTLQNWILKIWETKEFLWILYRTW